MIDNLETMNERKSQNYLGTIPERRTFVSNPIESIRKNQNPFPKCWKERKREGWRSIVDLKARTRAKGLSHPSNGCRGGKRSKERSRVPLRIMNESRNKVQDEL